MSAQTEESRIDWIIAPADPHEPLVHAALEGAAPVGAVGDDPAEWRLESATPRRSVFDSRQDGRLLRLVGYATDATSAVADAVNAWTRRALAADEHQAIIAAGTWKPTNGDAEAGGFLLWSLPGESAPLKRRLSSTDLEHGHREAAARSLMKIVEDLRDAGFTGLSAAIRTALIDADSGRLHLWETDLLHIPEDEKRGKRELGRDERAAARLAARILAPTGRSLDDLGVL